MADRGLGPATRQRLLEMRRRVGQVDHGIGLLRRKREAIVGELFRQVSMQEIGASTIQSRALAGISNGTLVCCLPGSPGACRTAWNEILLGQLDSRTRPCNFVPHLKVQPDQAERLCCGSRA